MNTFGAVIGTVAAGFFLIEALGIKWSLGVAVAINFGVALVALLLAGQAQEIETDGTELEKTETDAPRSTATRGYNIWC